MINKLLVVRCQQGKNSMRNIHLAHRSSKRKQVERARSIWPGDSAGKTAVHADKECKELASVSRMHGAYRDRGGCPFGSGTFCSPHHVVAACCSTLQYTRTCFGRARPTSPCIPLATECKQYGVASSYSVYLQILR